MNNIFDSVEIKMLEELAKRGALTGKRSYDKKKYLKDLIRHLYLQLLKKLTTMKKRTTKRLRRIYVPSYL